jgi:hypothetical protein
VLHSISVSAPSPSCLGRRAIDACAHTLGRCPSPGWYMNKSLETEAAKNKVLSWDTLVASSALIAALCFYSGHEFLAARLRINYGFHGPALSIYSYEELLMVGVTIVAGYLAPNFLLSLALAYIIHWRLPAVPRKILAIALVLCFSIVPVLTPTPLFHPFRWWLSAYWWHFIRLSYVALLLGALEHSAGNFLSRLPRKPVATFIVLEFLYLVWLTPRLLPDVPNSLQHVQISMRDGTSVQGVLLSQRERAFIVGYPGRQVVEVIPSDLVSRVTIDGEQQARNDLTGNANTQKAIPSKRP